MCVAKRGVALRDGAARGVLVAERGGAGARGRRVPRVAPRRRPPRALAPPAAAARARAAALAGGPPRYCRTGAKLAV